MNVAPSATFEATCNGFATGLTGTLGVRILDNQGGTTLARTTAGVAEVPAGSGRYEVTLTAPSLAGQYTLFWDDGTVAPGHVADEDLLVTSSVVAAGLPAAADLCTLADVRAAMETEAADTDLDALIQVYITDASLLIVMETQRELAPATASATRDMRVAGSRVVDLAPYDLRSATTVTLDPAGAGQVLVAGVDYELRPVGGTSVGGVYTSIMLSRWLDVAGLASVDAFGQATVRVSGAWGFASVPVVAKEACVFTVRSWLRRTYPDGYALPTEEPRSPASPLAGYALPLAAKSMLRPLYRNIVGAY